MDTAVALGTAPSSEPVTATLIGEVVVTPPDPRPAQSVRVEVRAPNGSVLEGSRPPRNDQRRPWRRPLYAVRPTGPASPEVLAVSGSVTERQLKSARRGRRADALHDGRRAGAAFDVVDLLAQQTPGQPHEVMLGLGLLPGGSQRRRRERGFDAAFVGHAPAIATKEAKDQAPETAPRTATSGTSATARAR